MIPILNQSGMKKDSDNTVAHINTNGRKNAQKNVERSASQNL
jgi:hypothetical protein